MAKSPLLHNQNYIIGNKFSKTYTCIFYYCDALRSHSYLNYILFSPFVCVHIFSVYIYKQIWENTLFMLVPLCYPFNMNLIMITAWRRLILQCVGWWSIKLTVYVGSIRNVHQFQYLIAISGG